MIAPVFAGALLAGTMGCDIINPPEDIPAFLYIEPFQLQTNPSTEGSPSHKITDVWVFVNNKFLGAYTLPAIVPVLAAGESEIRLDPGIKDNGVTATPEVYPFYAPYNITLELAPDQADTIRPVTKYLDNVRFAMIEGFEGPNHAFRDLRQGNDINKIQLTDVNAFEGNYSGLIYLDTANAAVELATVDRFTNLQERGVYVYLEMNYKSDVPVYFGIVGKDNGVPGTTPVYDPGFLPKDEWNKIYFNISALVFEGKFDEIQIGLYTAIPYTNGQFTQTEGRVWLDNIKLVHF